MTLVRIREHVEKLASDDGEYYVVCGRTGDRPVPAIGKRFDGRATARNAVRATEQYRTALRRYDPHVPYYDLIVCQEFDPGASAPGTPSRHAFRDDDPRSVQKDDVRFDPTADDCAADPEHRQLVEFCHGVAAATFETLSDEGYDAVERAVMEAYFALAETVADPDELCLCLLESMATELGTRLSPANQAAVLAGAATRLTPVEPAERPLTATLTRLRDRGLLDDYARTPWVVDRTGRERSAVVQLSNYALSPRDGRLPVLPIVLVLRRQRADLPLSSVRVAAVDGGWQLTLVLAPDSDPGELASAPIGPEGP